MPFFVHSKRGRASKLIEELHAINFDSTNIELSDDLSEKYTEAKSIVNGWREHYKIPSTDERYLNATISDIYEDYLTIKLRELKEFFDERIPKESQSNSPKGSITPEELDRLIEEDVNAIKMCKENYAEDYEIEAWEREKENALSQQRFGSQLSSEEIKRIAEIKINEAHQSRLKNG